MRRQLKYYSFLCLAERLLISCSFDRNIFPEQFRLMGRIRLPIMPETLYFQKFKASRNWEKSVFIQIYLTITSKNFSIEKICCVSSKTSCYEIFLFCWIFGIYISCTGEKNENTTIIFRDFEFIKRGFLEICPNFILMVVFYYILVSKYIWIARFIFIYFI